MANNTSIYGLDLSNNQIGDEGAIALATNSTLNTLDVSYNQIGTLGIEALLINSSIESVYMAGNPGSPSSVKKRLFINKRHAMLRACAASNYKSIGTCVR